MDLNVYHRLVYSEVRARKYPTKKCRRTSGLKKYPIKGDIGSKTTYENSIDT